MCISENHWAVREQILAKLITVQPSYFSFEKRKSCQILAVLGKYYSNHTQGNLETFESVIISFLQNILSEILKTENKIQPKAQQSLSKGTINFFNSLCKKQSEVSIGRTRE